MCPYIYIHIQIYIHQCIKNTHLHTSTHEDTYTRPCAYFGNHEFTPIGPISIHPHRVLCAFSHLLNPITYLREYQRLFSPYYYMDLIHFKRDEMLPQSSQQNYMPVLSDNKVSFINQCQNRSLPKTITIGLAQSSCHHLHP